MKGIFKVLSMVILLAALIGAAVLVKDNQETRRGATAAETSAQVLPDKVITKAGQTFSVNVILNTGKDTDKLTGAEFRLGFDPAKVAYVSSEERNGYTILSEDSEGGADRSFKIVAMGVEKAGAVDVVKLTFRAVSDGASSIIVGKGAVVMVSGQTGTWEVAKASGSQIETGISTTTVAPTISCSWCGNECVVSKQNMNCPKVAQIKDQQCVVDRTGMGCQIVSTQDKPCSSDANCSPNEYCYQPPMPSCPPGAMCKQMMPMRVCRSKKIVGEGEMCGGIAGIMCSSGLQCDYGLKTIPRGGIVADGSGVCVRTEKPTLTPTISVVTTPSAACGQRCTQDQQCQGGLTCAPIWWPCGPMPATAMSKLRADQGLTQAEVAEMIRVCPTVKGVMPSGFESMNTVKMPSFYGVCRNPKCVSSTNCNCVPVPQCTPVACRPGEGLYCPTGSGTCVGGCGFKCGTPTPTPTPSTGIVNNLGTYIMQFSSDKVKVGEEVLLNLAAEAGDNTNKISATKVKIKYFSENFDVLDIQPEGRGTELMREIDKTAGTITLYYTWNLPADRLFNRYTVANIKLKPKKEGTFMVTFDRTYSNEMSGIDGNGKSISYKLNMNDPKDLVVSAITCGCVNGKVKTTGDANCDGLVNSVDFEIWRNEMFDQGGLFGTIKPTWQSDFSCDQKVSGTDFEIWRRTVFK